MTVEHETDVGRDRRTTVATTGSDDFESLYRTHWMRLRRLAEKTLGDTPFAEDVAQDTFLVLLMHGNTYRAEGALGAWLAGIAKNVARTIRRRARHRSELSLAAASTRLSPDSAPDDRANASILVARLAEAVEALAPGQQELVRLRYEDGLSVREIAARLDRTEGSVKLALFRLRRRLAASIDRRP